MHHSINVMAIKFYCIHAKLSERASVCPSAWNFLMMWLFLQWFIPPTKSRRIPLLRQEQLLHCFPTYKAHSRSRSWENSQDSFITLITPGHRRNLKKWKQLIHFFAWKLVPVLRFIVVERWYCDACFFEDWWVKNVLFTFSCLNQSQR